MLTIDQLYEAYMDTGDYAPGESGIGRPFAEDVYEFFGAESTGYSRQKWARDWGRYLPSYDPAEVELSSRVRELDQKKALDTLALTKQATDRVYNTELDTLSTQLGTEMKKAEEVSGRLGLRSGAIESALSDTMAATSNKVKDLGDRLEIQNKKDQNTYEAATVDAALDFDKAEHQTKKDFYQRTLAAMDRLAQVGAFEKVPEGGDSGYDIYDPEGGAGTTDPVIDLDEPVSDALACLGTATGCAALATGCLWPGGQSYNECYDDCMHRNGC